MMDNCLFLFPFRGFYFPSQNIRFPYICMKYKNYTPHEIHLNDGTVIPPSGQVARVEASYTPFDKNGVCRQVFGPVTGLPPQEEGFYVIVSLAVLQRASDRTDLVAPATGHKECVRENGMIKSVPGFVQF